MAVPLMSRDIKLTQFFNEGGKLFNFRQFISNREVNESLPKACGNLEIAVAFIDNFFNLVKANRAFGHDVILVPEIFN